MSLLNICLGKCGYMMGNEFWTRIYNEHKTFNSSDDPEIVMNGTKYFFHDTPNETLIPRTIFIDSDIATLDFIYNSQQNYE
jgi:hypothetical protein